MALRTHVVRATQIAQGWFRFLPAVMVASVLKPKLVMTVTAVTPMLASIPASPPAAAVGMSALGSRRVTMVTRPTATFARHALRPDLPDELWGK